MVNLSLSTHSDDEEEADEPAPKIERQKTMVQRMDSLYQQKKLGVLRTLGLKKRNAANRDQVRRGMVAANMQSLSSIPSMI